MKRILVVGLMAMAFGAPAALAQTGDGPGGLPETVNELPDVDPLDTASCEVEPEGWVVVARSYLEAWQAARESGDIDDQMHELLVDRMFAWDEYYTRTKDHMPSCLEQIDIRTTFEF